MPKILREVSLTYPIGLLQEQEKPLPAPEITLQLTDFGAVPDDGIDDTAAFEAAVAAAQDQAGMVVIVASWPGHFTAGIDD